MTALHMSPDDKRRVSGSAGSAKAMHLSPYLGQLAKDVRFQWKQALRVLKHPFDAFGELRYRSEGSFLAAVLLLIAAFAVLLLSKLATSYLFNPSGVENVSPLTLLLQFFVPWLTWVAANYWIGSIMKGQGRWTEVFVGSTYALMPFLLLSLPLALLSNVLTLNEKVVYDFGNGVMIGWTLLLFFIMVKEIHNYDIGETAVNVVLSVLFMFAIWILLFILAGLTFQLYDFVAQIVKEVAYRV
ncbi:hypothetical protein YDYSG_66330 [Paenibacillus tyrfis]|uniref:YIP1 family protein n=1 Tax=Paenibacillus tyrfis TaxID=1501230 RepID=UPI00249130A7|nr:YIP1 family protein [Paenibacillus tyrfis]GLI10599.1 hypothetical protein YDYSG_66330 [Paenibacillus tyrfis]